MITEKQIYEILKRNITYVDYEGACVSEDGIVLDILELIKNDKQREKEDSGGGNQCTCSKPVEWDSYPSNGNREDIRVDRGY